MEKIWLKSYPKGVPAEIDLNEFASIGDLFERSVKRYDDRIAFVNMGKGITYREIDTLTAQFASFLQNHLNLPQGSRIALMMPNCLQYPICVYGALRAGYIVVNCNPLYTARELEHQLRDAGADAIVIVENFAHTLQDALAHVSVKHVIVTGLGDMLGTLKGAIVNFVVKRIKKMVAPWHIPHHLRFKQALADGAMHALRPVKVTHEDLAFLQYTGGTTGVAKAAMLTHGNMLANMQQAHAWIAPAIDDYEVIITALPLYHIFSLLANCLLYFKIGAKNVLITNPRDIPGFIKELSKYPFSSITGVNTLFNALLNHPDFAKLDFSHLNIVLGGGMAVQHSVAERWKKATGKVLIEAYGLTEASPGISINPVDLAEYNGSIGLPLPSTEIAIRDDDGRDLGIGEQGELCARGPQVMKGYYNRPDETAMVMMPDGFLRTGDIAVVDERGFVRLVDRKKDMILVSGFNVYPNEIEDVVASMAGVLEVAAVGVPDEHSGEHVKLFVVKKDPALTEEAVLAHCKANLTGYKRPKAVEFRKELPKTNVGKILRRSLRDEARQK